MEAIAELLQSGESDRLAEGGHGAEEVREALASAGAALLGEQEADDAAMASEDAWAEKPTAARVLCALLELLAEHGCVREVELWCRGVREAPAVVFGADATAPQTLRCIADLRWQRARRGSARRDEVGAARSLLQLALRLAPDPCVVCSAAGRRLQALATAHRNGAGEAGAAAEDDAEGADAPFGWIDARCAPAAADVVVDALGRLLDEVDRVRGADAAAIKSSVEPEAPAVAAQQERARSVAARVASLVRRGAQKRGGTVLSS